MTTGTVPSSCRSGTAAVMTAAVMTQSEQTAGEHSTLEQQPPGTLNRPAWCVVWTVWPASTWKHSGGADVNLSQQSYGGSRRGMTVPCRWGSDTQEHITETGFSPELAANVVHGGVELCALTWPVSRGSKTITFLESPTPICLVTIQLLWSYDDD